MLEPRDIYSIIALTAYYNQCFGTCSRAFIKLEGLEGASAAERDGYRDLAFSIFMRARPTDPPDTPANSVKCPTRSCDATLKTWALNCMACGANFPPCVASGRPIIGTDYWRCKVCRHKALKGEVKDAVACPLCHAPVSGSSAPPAAPASASASSSRRDIAAAAPTQAGAGGGVAAQNARRGSGGPAPSAAEQAESKKAAAAAATAALLGAA
jgi:DNA-directed RNA polymerase subunit RPC12/RpoP